MGGPSLSLNQVYALNSLLSCEESETLEQLSLSLHRDFPSTEQLKVGLALLALLCENDLLPKATQRLVAVFFLHELYKNEQLTSNPFLPIFLKLLSNEKDGSSAELIGALPTLTTQERYFLVALLSHAASDLLKRTPKQITQLDVPTAVNADTNHLESHVKEMQSRYNAYSLESLPSAINIPDAEAATSLQYSSQQAQLKSWEQFLTGTAPAAFSTQRPVFHRIAPPLHISDDEYVWFNSLELQRFMPRWDEQMCVKPTVEVGVESADTSSATDWTTTEQGEETKSEVSEAQKEESSQSSGDGRYDASEILTRALSSQLQLDEAQWLIEQIRNDHSVVEKIKMTPDKLPGLVEDNPMVAVEVLHSLLPSKEITSFFEALINMELSVHGMEVVNRLTSLVDVPEEFLAVYVSQCICSCENMKESPYTQNRLVRMVCVFLSSLIRNKLINVQDLYIELQAFCINFSGVREAAALFQTVQMINRENNKEEDGST